MHIRAIKLRDRDFGGQWSDEIEDRWEYADFLGRPDWRRDWISFDCLCHDPVTDTVFCGITSFDADIFWGWRRREERWFDPGYARVRDRYDAKFHRALVRDARTGWLYGAPALLHDIDHFQDAPGAAIVRYDPVNNRIDKLGTPLPHVYVQALVLDEPRDTLYAQTFTPENLVSYRLGDGQSRNLGPTGSGLALAQGENIELDADGNVWGVWSVTRAWQTRPGVDQYRFYKYDPAAGRIAYLDRGLPHPDGRPGYVKPEGFFNLGDGCLYVSGGEGGLYRLNPRTGEALFLFQAIDTGGTGRRSRLASLRLGPDGHAYGVAGRDGACELLRFNPRDETWSLLGPVRDAATGVSAWQIHDVCVLPDGTIYAGENDHPRRSGYLWEIRP